MVRVIVFLAMLIPSYLEAQNIGINNDGSAPDLTSILDIKSNSKGVLMPRLTTLERTGIASPAIGLTVFDMDTYSYWMYRGELNGGWAEMQHNFQNFWDMSGSNVFSKNTGNIGIGTNSPGSKLTVDGIDPEIGIRNSGLNNSFIRANGFDLKIGTSNDNVNGKLILGTKDNNNFNIDNLGRISMATNSSFNAELKLNGPFSPARFAFMHQDVAVGIMTASTGQGFRIGTYAFANAQITFAPRGTDKIWIDEDGQLGIGTATPSSLLTVNGFNPYLQIQHNNVNTGFLQAIGSNLKLGTNSTNLTGNLFLQTKLVDRMMIDENGLVGIGTNSPNAILTVNATNPIVQLKNSGVDKGFVQLVNDDIKIGTNISNTTGKFIVRTKGVDRFTIDDDGYTTLGSNTSEGLISINGQNFPGINFLHNNLNQGSITAISGTLDIHRDNPGNIRIRAGSDGMWFKSNGQISMGGGGLTASGYVLSIEGKAIATEFKVLPVGSWPDYVFANEYKLKPLADVKKYIAENKHLPNIPSAAEVDQNGIALGEMSKKLMEKVEELTLYILDLQEQIDELKKNK